MDKMHFGLILYILTSEDNSSWTSVDWMTSGKLSTLNPRMVSNTTPNGRVFASVKLLLLLWFIVKLCKVVARRLKYFAITYKIDSTY